MPDLNEHNFNTTVARLDHFESRLQWLLEEFKKEKLLGANSTELIDRRMKACERLSDRLYTEPQFVVKDDGENQSLIMIEAEKKIQALHYKIGQLEGKLILRDEENKRLAEQNQELDDMNRHSLIRIQKLEKLLPQGLPTLHCRRPNPEHHLMNKSSNCL